MFRISLFISLLFSDQNTSFSTISISKLSILLVFYYLTLVYLILFYLILSLIFIDLRSIHKMSKLLGAANNELHVQNSAQSCDSSCFDILYKLLLLLLIFDLNQSYHLISLISYLYLSFLSLVSYVINHNYQQFSTSLSPLSFSLNMSEEFCKNLLYTFYTSSTRG